MTERSGHTHKQNLHNCPHTRRLRRVSSSSLCFHDFTLASHRSARDFRLNMDAEDSGPETISVLIKTPNQVREDHVLEDVHLDWTVRELKTRLSAVYATKPVS